VVEVLLFLAPVIGLIAFAGFVGLIPEEFISFGRKREEGEIVLRPLSNYWLLTPTTRVKIMKMGKDWIRVQGDDKKHKRNLNVILVYFSATQTRLQNNILPFSQIPPNITTNCTFNLNYSPTH